MPVAFAGNGPKVYGAKIVYEVHLRDHIAALVQEVLKLVFVAPVIDGRFSIAGDLADQQRMVKEVHRDKNAQLKAEQQMNGI